MADVFVLETFDLNTLGEMLLVKAAVDLRQQVLYAAKAGEAFDVLRVEVAEFGFVQLVITLAAFAPSQKAEPVVEVALYGADVGFKFFGQLFAVQAFACVESTENGGEAVGQFFVFAAHNDMVAVGCWNVCDCK